MFSVDPLPYPPLRGELRLINGKVSKAEVLKEIAIIEGTAEREAETERALITPPNNHATESAILQQAKTYSRPLAVEARSCNKDNINKKKEDIVSELLTAGIVFTQHFASSEDQLPDVRNSTRIALTALDQHMTVHAEFPAEAGRSGSGALPPPFAPRVLLPSASAVDFEPVSDEDALKNVHNTVAHTTVEENTASNSEEIENKPRPSAQATAVSLAYKTSQVCSMLYEPCPIITSTATKTPTSDEAKVSSHSIHQQPWTVCHTPAAMVCMSGSQRDDTVWGVTAQGLVYARIPNTDASTGVTLLSEDERKGEEEQTNGNAIDNRVSKPIRSKSLAERREEEQNLRVARYFSRRMDESSSSGSDNDDDDDEANDPSQKDEGAKNEKRSTPPQQQLFHCSWSMVNPSEVDHAAYRLRGRKAPTNIVPHQQFRFVAAASRECVWAITNDSDDAGRLVRREGFDRRDCVRGRNQPPIPYQHRVGEKWVDYSDDVVPVPAHIRERGGWFPPPLYPNGAHQIKVSTTSGDSPSSGGAADDLSSLPPPPPTAWVTHPTDCPFLAADSRQYGNALVEALSEQENAIGGAKYTRQSVGSGGGVVVGSDLAMVITNTTVNHNNTNTTVAAALESPAPASRKIGGKRNPLVVKTIESLKKREFVWASVGQDGSLWAVTEEEVITNLNPSQSHASVLAGGVKKVWSRLWFREGSSLESPGYRWIEATELFESVDTLDPTDPFAVSSIASARYSKDGAVATIVPRLRILSLAHSVQHELFAVIAIGGIDDKDDDDDDEGEEDDHKKRKSTTNNDQSEENDPLWTRSIASQYDPRRRGFLFQRIGITQLNPTGTHWRRVVLEDDDNNITRSSVFSNTNRCSFRQLIPIRSFAFCTVPNKRHWDANGMLDFYEENNSKHLDDMYPSFCSVIASAVVVTDDGRRVLDITSALRKHMATQEQSVTYKIPSSKSGRAGVPLPYGRVVIGDLLPLPLVLLHRAKLVVKQGSTPNNNWEMDAHPSIPAAPSSPSNALIITVPSELHHNNSNKPHVIVASGTNRLGVGLNRFDTALRTLRGPNVVDVFVDTALLCYEKQKVLNPMSVRDLSIGADSGTKTTSVSFGIENEQEEAFSTRSARGIRVPANLVEGLRGKLQLLRHRSSVPVPDYLRGSLLSMAITRNKTRKSKGWVGHLETNGSKRQQGGEETKGALVLKEAQQEGDAKDDENDTTDIVLTVTIDLNDEAGLDSSSDSASESEDDREGGGEDNSEEGERGEKRRTRAQFATLTLWLYRQPPSPIPSTSAFSVAYARLHIARYQCPNPPLIATCGSSATPSLGGGDPIANFVHRIAGCDLNGREQMKRFQRSVLASLRDDGGHFDPNNNNNNNNNDNAVCTWRCLDDNQRESYNNNKHLPTAIAYTPEEEYGCNHHTPLIQTAVAAVAANGQGVPKETEKQRRKKQKIHLVKVNLTIEFLCGQCRLPDGFFDDDVGHVAASSGVDQSLAVTRRLLATAQKEEAARNGHDIEEMTYATNTCRTTISLHPSTIRVLGLKPAELDESHLHRSGVNSSASPLPSSSTHVDLPPLQPLTTITVTHRGGPLGHNASVYEEEGGDGDGSIETAISLPASWRHGYGDPKVVIAVPLEAHTAMRDLAKLFAVVPAATATDIGQSEDSNANSPSLLSDAHSREYLIRLEALRSLLVAREAHPAGAKEEKVEETVGATKDQKSYARGSRTILYLSNGT